MRAAESNYSGRGAVRQKTQLPVFKPTRIEGAVKWLLKCSELALAHGSLPRLAPSEPQPDEA